MDTWFVLPILALIGGLICLTLIGQQVLNRGVVFIDLAVAQAAAAAVIWMHFWLHTESTWIDQLAATTGAWIVSLGIAQLVKKQPQHREAMIGLLYVIGACLAMLGASQNPHGREKLMQLLAADILWVDTTHVYALLLCAVVMLLIQSKQWLKTDWIFYSVFAILASIAVPALGLFLVFSMLIAPALWAARGMPVRLAITASMLAATLGLIASWVLDLPSGTSIAISLALWGVASIVNRLKKHP